VTAKLPTLSWAGSLARFLLHGALGVRGAVQIVEDKVTPAVFGNGSRAIWAKFHNPTAQPAEINLRFRLFQASASTMMPVGEPKTWKTITLLAGQTVLESLTVELPQVRAET